jgi:methionyl-tRNA formyltransferase
MENSMRLVFAGTPGNAASTLEALVSAGFDVIGVITRKDSKIGRNRELTESPVAAVAAQCGIETIKANSFSAEVHSWIERKSPDLGVIVAFGSILKKQTLDIPMRGWVNLHYSLLPDFPGAAPVQHAILGGETVTGVTVFRLDEGIDTGPILARREFPIEQDMTAGELLSALTEVGSELMIETLSSLEEHLSNQQRQPVRQAINFAGKLSRSDAKIDFSRPAIEIHNLVRAMNPEPIAWFEYDNSPIRVLKSAATDVSDLPKGNSMLQSGELLIGCGKGALTLLQVQPAGRNSMRGADWFRGLRQDSIRIS